MLLIVALRLSYDENKFCFSASYPDWQLKLCSHNQAIYNEAEKEKRLLCVCV